MVSFDGTRYSVPVICAGRNVLVRAYVDRVDITCRDRVVASHRRCYQNCS